MNKASFILGASRLGLLAIMFFVCGGVVFSQDAVEKAVKAEKAHKAEYKNKEFCSNNNWSNGDKVSVTDLREMTVPASGTISINGGRNGGVKVKGENRSDVIIRACVQAWGVSDEAARSIASSIRIGTGGVVKAEGPEENGWSVSYEARVPHNSNLKLTAHNGGIAISSVDGRLEFETSNGGVSLMDVAGDVQGRTTNGGVHVSLAGSTWKGAGLNVETTNGGVNLTIPENYAANIETGTVNGGFKSDIQALNITTEDVKGGWANRPKEIKTAINGGGAPVRVITRNGGIRIGTTPTN